MSRCIGPFLMLCLSALTIAPVAMHSQTAAARPRTGGSGRQVELRFNDEKPVLGLPPDLPRSRPRCAADGVTYFDVQTGRASATVPMVYGVAPGGEVKGVARKTPSDFNSVAVQDFFAGDSSLVTLLRAEKRDDDGTLRDTEYFVFTSDRDGDHPDLERLDVRFTPLKVGVFGSGNFMVLGWDRANLMPVLVIVKDDGTVRRFLDLSKGKTTDAEGYAADPSQADSALKTLRDAAFVPFGRNLLLTYPGTARAARVMDEMGEMRSLALGLPPGYVLRDVINSGDEYAMVVRTQAKDYAAPADAEEADRTALWYPAQRVFEVSSYSGGVLQEFLFDKPDIMALTCAVSRHLTAIFPDTLAGQTGSGAASQKPGTGDGQGTPQPAATQLVVSTVRR